MRTAWAFITLASLSASAAPLSSEVGIDHPPAQIDPRDDAQVAVAAGPSGYLAVWYLANTLRGARIDPSGSVLDPIGFDIGTGNGAHRPVVAWDGSDYLVVWTTGSEIRARTVSPSGQTGAGTLTVTSSTDSLRWPAVACSGTECLIAWWRYNVNSGHRVELAVVSSGAVQQSNLPVTSAASDQSQPSVSWDGTQYLVVWSDIRRPDGGDIYAARVTPLGAVLDGDGIAVSAAAGAETQPVVSWNGNQHFVLWRDTRSGTAQIFGARVDSAGNVQDASGLPVGTSSLELGDPAITWNGVEHLVAWTEGRSSVRAARVTVSGAIQSAFDLSTPSYSSARPALAASAADVLIAWQDGRWGESDIYAARIIEGAIAPPGEFYVSGMPSREEEPALASDGTDFFAVWRDYRGGFGDTEIYGTRLTTEGTVLDPAGIFVSRGPLLSASEPAVAWGANTYLVVWTQRTRSVGTSTYQVHGARVAADGSVLDATPFLIASEADEGEPDVAWNGSDFFVVWSAGQIHGARVTPQGQVRDTTPLRISRSSNPTARPAIGWSGQVHLVVWEHRVNEGSYVHGARLDAEGTPLDCGDLALGTVSSGNWTPDVAGSPHGFLVAFDTLGTLRVRRLDPNGGLLDSAPLVVNPNLRGGPSTVTWDGASWVVAWVPSTQYARTREIRAVRLGPWGSVLDPEPWVVAPSMAVSTWEHSYRTVRVASASAGDGGAALVYTRPVPLPGYENSSLVRETHLWARTWAAAPNGAACASSDLCSSAACIDGRCCDRPCSAGQCGAGTCLDPDAGVVSDPDFGQGCAVDAGSGFCIDAGADGTFCFPEEWVSDGGSPAPSDAGSDPSRTPRGCGCGAAVGTTFWLGLLTLLGAARARRRAR